MINNRSATHKRYYFLVIIIFACFIGFASKIYFEWQRFLATPVIPQGQQLEYIFVPGSTIKDLALFLQQKKYLKRSYLLVWLAQLNGQATHLKAGEYLFQGGILPKALLEQMSRGEVRQRDITIIPGWTFHRIRQALAKVPHLRHVIAKLTTAEILIRLGSSHKNLEGLLYPDTYRYTMNTSDFDVIKKAYGSMQKKLHQAWLDRAPNLPYLSSYDALIVASMVEKETALPKERPLIAGIIINRLRKKMYLQIDPTVIYALIYKSASHFQSVLTSSDLRVKSPYNTYIHKGLPPTPIAMPSEKSIIAALHPAKTNDLYFVAKGDGSHYFSTSLKQHDKAIEKYLLRQQ